MQLHLQGFRWAIDNDKWQARVDSIKPVFEGKRSRRLNYILESILLVSLQRLVSFFALGSLPIVDSFASIFVSNQSTYDYSVVDSSFFINSLLFDSFERKPRPSFSVSCLRRQGCVYFSDSFIFSVVLQKHELILGRV